MFMGRTLCIMFYVVISTIRCPSYYSFLFQKVKTLEVGTHRVKANIVSQCCHYRALFSYRGGRVDGGSPCCMSIMRNANGALSILRKGRIALSILRKCRVECR